MNRSACYACTVCSYGYNPALGDPEHGIPRGTSFEDLPEDWRCPWCGATKAQFVREDGWEREDQDSRKRGAS